MLKHRGSSGGATQTMFMFLMMFIVIIAAISIGSAVVLNTTLTPDQRIAGLGFVGIVFVFIFGGALTIGALTIRSKGRMR